MFALDFIKSDDTPDVVFADAQAAEGDDAVARGVEQRFEDASYVSVSNVKGFTKPVVPKASTRRSAHRLLRSALQSTSSDPVELSDDIEVSEGQDVDVEKEKKLVVHGKKKASTKKVVMTHVQGSSSKDVEGLSEDKVYVPDWSVKFSKTKEKMKSSMAVMKKEINGFSKKEEVWVKKVGELTRRHEIEMNDLKKSFEADKLKLKVDREA
ncbi:hypothetical protein Hdeb2414_s0007g00254731 [Helianthus debilis subsp. tardiflorus]